jgi:hypothetical protein
MQMASIQRVRGCLYCRRRRRARARLSVMGMWIWFWTSMDSECRDSPHVYDNASKESSCRASAWLLFRCVALDLLVPTGPCPCCPPSWYRSRGQTTNDPRSLPLPPSRRRRRISWRCGLSGRDGYEAFGCCCMRSSNHGCVSLWAGTSRDERRSMLVWSWGDECYRRELGGIVHRHVT